MLQNRLLTKCNCCIKNKQTHKFTRYHPCWGRVWKALKWTFGNQIENLPIGSRHAYDFARWANPNVQGLLQNFKLKKMSVSGSDIPVGSVVVWKPGQCGYSATAGHIEIVVSPGKACSFYCGAICTSAVPEVYVPVKRQAVSDTSVPSMATSFGNSLPNVGQDFSSADSFMYPGAAGSETSMSLPTFAPAGSGPSPAVVDKPLPSVGYQAPDSQCKYGRTSEGYCNISPDLNPFALNRQTSVYAFPLPPFVLRTKGVFLLRGASVPNSNLSQF